MKKHTLRTWILQAAVILAVTPAVFAQQQNDNTTTQTYTRTDKDGKSDTYTYTWKNDHFNNNFNGHRDPCKVFIGVETNNLPSGGLKVTRVLDGTPAQKSGVQEGDIIVSLDNVTVNTQSALIAQRDKHQQGEAFTLAIQRDGKDMNINARFNSCTAEEQAESKKMAEKNADCMARMGDQMKALEEKMAELGTSMESIQRPILGIYPGDENPAERGVVVGSVISGKGAAAAGLQEGDVIVNVGGKAINGEGGIGRALSGHKAGDQVNVVYLRNGQTQQTNVTLSTDRTFARTMVERDPCKVFIGVYTSNAGVEGKGVRVNGVIDNTPAKESDIIIGDIILQLDDVAIATHNGLQIERDKHQPGDEFTLTILRNGQTMKVNARFKACDKTNAVTEKPASEVVELLNEEPKDAQLRDLGNGVKMNIFQVSPNPTVGILNIQFEAEAVPTTVNITDLSGKTVYTNTINQFSGVFSEQLNLEDQAPGNYVLSIRQGDKVSTKKFVLMPRA